jgi:hypothetical protein
MKQLIYLTALAVSLGTASAFAQEDSENITAGLDVTIALVPADAELPDVVTAPIDLPKDEDGNDIPSAEGVENSAHGLETANRAREDGRAFGEAMAAAAQQNREDAAHGPPDLEDLRPDQAPDVPGPPETPGPPAQ